jgi:Coenzyme PQQ synthesis protein D (PqqD)
MAGIPVPHAGIRIQETDQGLIRLSYPLSLKPWIARLLPDRISLPIRTLELDSMGSFVWNQIDGKASVLELAGRVTKKYACHPSEAEHAVAAFIRQLGRRGILGLR